MFDDDDEASITFENVRSGTIAQGDAGVLFNASAVGGNTLENMQAAWGSSVNFIPVTNWTDLTNTGDTIALWSSLSAYQGETQSMTQPRRTTNNAAAVVAFDDDTMLGWPANNNASSIFLANLTSNPAAAGSWLRSNNTNSSAPQPLLAEVVDHPGGDIGSPGHVPGMAALPVDGDYNGNGVVDAADYVLWRRAMSTATPLQRDTTPESVSTADYELWRANFGKTGASSSALASASVPEPTGAVLMTIMFGWLGSRLRRAPRSSSSWGLVRASTPGTRVEVAVTRRRWRPALR